MVAGTTISPAAFRKEDGVSAVFMFGSIPDEITLSMPRLLEALPNASFAPGIASRAPAVMAERPPRIKESSSERPCATLAPKDPIPAPAIGPSGVAANIIGTAISVTFTPAALRPAPANAPIGPPITKPRAASPNISSAPPTPLAGSSSAMRRQPSAPGSITSTAQFAFLPFLADVSCAKR